MKLLALKERTYTHTSYTARDEFGCSLQCKPNNFAIGRMSEFNLPVDGAKPNS